MNAANLLVRALEQEGVTYIFGVPGEENLDFIEALRTSSITLVVTRHEQAAGFMAATVGRLTGKIGVCLSTLGPGATNLVTAAAYANLGGMPMLLITGQKPIKTSKQGQFQIIDTVQMFQPITKFSKQIVHGNSIPSLVREAVRIAEDERPGAVHLALPEDIAAEPVNATLIEVTKVRRPVAEEKAISKAVEMIEAAKRPLLLIGAGANRKLTSKMLREFVDKLRIPVVTTQMGKGVVDERNPLFLGCTALTQNDYVHCAIDRADLLINVGHDVIEKPPFIMQKDGFKVIHIHFLRAHFSEIYFPQLEVVGDIANAIWQIKERVQLSNNWDFDYFKKVQEQIKMHLQEKITDDQYPLKPQRLIRDTRQALPEDGVVCLDNGMYKLWFARGYSTHFPNTLLLDNALATMGAGLPSAMATKLLLPERAVVAICGDGGIMMNSQELETAVRMKLDLIVVVIRDDGYGMISWKQQSMNLGDFGLRFGNPDFVAYAQSYGAQGHRITKAEDYAPLLEKLLKETGVHLIEVMIDYSENEAVFTRQLAEKVCVT